MGELSAQLLEESEVAVLQSRLRTQEAHDLRQVLAQYQSVQRSCGPADFRGQAATAFRAHLEEVPANLRGVASGYDVVASDLAAYGRKLADLAAQAQRAERQRDEARRAQEQAAREAAAAEESAAAARSSLAAAQSATAAADADPTPAGAARSARAAAREAVAAARLAAAEEAGRRAREREQTAITARLKAEADLEEIRTQHRQQGDRTADRLLDTLDTPWQQDAWDLVERAGRALVPGGLDWLDFVNGMAYAPVEIAAFLAERADAVPLAALKAAAKTGTAAERAAARKAYKEALKGVRGLKRTAGAMADLPVPGWLKEINRSLGERSSVLDGIRYVRDVPGLAVVLGGYATYEDVHSGHMGVAHAVVKNGAAVGAGMATTAFVTGSVTIGATVGLPVVVGLAAGTVVSIAAGKVVQNYGDDVGRAAVGAGKAVGKGVRKGVGKAGKGAAHGIAHAWDKVNG